MLLTCSRKRNRLDTKLKNYIVQLVLRRGTMRWKPKNEAVKKARVELPPEINKDGTLSKKKNVRYRCAICKELVKGSAKNVDHIDPVIKINSSLAEMLLDEICERMYCGVEGFQVLCIPCHDAKTSIELAARAEYKRENNVNSEEPIKPSKKRKPNRSNRTK